MVHSPSTRQGISMNGRREDMGAHAAVRRANGKTNFVDALGEQNGFYTCIESW
jgi:hypothetical protein